MTVCTGNVQGFTSEKPLYNCPCGQCETLSLHADAIDFRREGRMVLVVAQIRCRECGNVLAKGSQWIRVKPIIKQQPSGRRFEGLYHLGDGRWI